MEKGRSDRGDVVVSFEEQEVVGEENEEEEETWRRTSDEPSSFSGSLAPLCRAWASPPQPLSIRIFPPATRGKHPDPQARLPLPSRLPRPHRIARALRPLRSTRRAATVTLKQYLLLPPLLEALPSRRRLQARALHAHARTAIGHRSERPSACMQRPSFSDTTGRSHGYRCDCTATSIWKDTISICAQGWFRASGRVGPRR
jgi:hypothetical protein